MKFVPASGAASRMFKDLFEFLDSDKVSPESDFEKTFFDNIHNFAFYSELNQACIKNEGKSINDLIADSNFKPVVANLLLDSGLNYGALPKGVLKFHNYPDSTRTAMEEHLVECALYCSNRKGEVNFHVRVFHEHVD